MGCVSISRSHLSDAKRAAKQGLSSATGLCGSSSTFDFEILAQVHCNRFWLGLRLNRTALARRTGTMPAEETKELEAHAPPLTVERTVPLWEKHGTADPSRSTAHEAASGDAEVVEPPLLSGFMVARMRQLGLDGPRDALDAVAPLWEMPIEEQLARKQDEMRALVSRLLPGEGGASCEPIRSLRASCDDKVAPPMRNTCEMSIGRDRSGSACCGFRLGVASSQDGNAVAPPSGVPFVPAWMVAAADECTAAMRELDGAREEGDGEEGLPPLPYLSLRLRGSLRTLEAVAVLTARDPPLAGARATPAESDLAGRLAHAAARHNQSLRAVLIRDVEGGCLPVLQPEKDAPASCDTPEVGTIVEELRSGLRLHVSPLAFFQVSTEAAEVLFSTVVEMATTDGFPDMVLDLCCGGGVLGLEVARAAAEQGVEAARVLGVELSTSGARDARVNAAANSLRHPQYEVICGKAEDCIGAIAGAATSANAVAILDPPRTGMAPSVCKALRATEAVKRVVLCSCNPHGHNLRRDFVVKGGSLAANLRVLCSERGRGTPFRVERIVPIDLFEHTPHVELCVLCVRAPSRSPTSTRPRPTRRERKRP